MTILPATIVLACIVFSPVADKPAYREGQIEKFGVYSLRYYEKRWRQMCKGAARYDAMREAESMGRPQPCQYSRGNQ